jgi:hypothetical protein
MKISKCCNKANVSYCLQLIVINVIDRWVYELEASHTCAASKYSLLCWREFFGIVLISDEKFNLTAEP